MVKIKAQTLIDWDSWAKGATIIRVSRNGWVKCQWPDKVHAGGDWTERNRVFSARAHWICQKQPYALEVTA